MTLATDYKAVESDPQFYHDSRPTVSTQQTFADDGKKNTQVFLMVSWFIHEYFISNWIFQSPHEAAKMLTQ